MKKKEAMTYANRRTEEKESNAKGDEAVYEGCNESKDGGEEESRVEGRAATQNI
jgi:hypothetical protein